MTDAVRLACPDDHDALMDLLRMKHDEDGLGRFDDRKASEAVERGVTRFRSMIGVIRGKTRVEASIGLYVETPWDSSDDHLADRWLFVHPQHRRSEHAKKMLHFAKWASEQLALPLLMTAFYNDQTAAKASLFDRSLPMAGSVYAFVPGNVIEGSVHRANQGRMISRVEFHEFASNAGEKRLRQYLLDNHRTPERARVWA